MYASAGNFDGGKNFKERDITVKYHLLNGAPVRRVTVNGKDNAFTENGKDSGVFPLNTAHTVADGAVVITTFKTRTDGEYEVKFYI